MHLKVRYVNSIEYRGEDISKPSADNLVREARPRPKDGIYERSSSKPKLLILRRREASRKLSQFLIALQPPSVFWKPSHLVALPAEKTKQKIQTPNGDAY